MKQPINDQKQHSSTRLSLVGKGTAILAWGLGIVYTVGELYMWFNHGTVMLQGILQAFSDSQPLLAEPSFQLSKMAIALLFILNFLPIIVTSAVWLLAGLFFLRLSRNELWTARNFKLLWAAGILNILSPFLYQLSWTGQSLAISLDLPPGERIFVFSLGLSTNSVYDVVVGIILCAFAWMIRESTKIHQENELYI
ncbi:hypothetical protein [Yersinia massiliensis]|uniref:hypothetical protein n=1 Tax=Yersinia massiliensis TaxID=419257 RepID=UPI0011A2215A|nr:hypothetical protein [Yersinia massiliensis]